MKPAGSQLKILACGSNATGAWADLAICGPERTVSAEFAEVLLGRYPALATHACKSRGATTFGEQLPGALLPHVAEHLAIELLVRAHPGQVFAGATTWLSREEGTMRVRLSHPECAPLKTAAQLLNNLLATEPRQTEQ